MFPNPCSATGQTPSDAQLSASIAHLAANPPESSTPPAFTRSLPTQQTDAAANLAAAISSLDAKAIETAAANNPHLFNASMLQDLVDEKQTHLARVVIKARPDLVDTLTWPDFRNVYVRPILNSPGPHTVERLCALARKFPTCAAQISANAPSPEVFGTALKVAPLPLDITLINKLARSPFPVWKAVLTQRPAAINTDMFRAAMEARNPILVIALCTHAPHLMGQPDAQGNTWCHLAAAHSQGMLTIVQNRMRALGMGDPSAVNHRGQRPQDLLARIS